MNLRVFVIAAHYSQKIGCVNSRIIVSDSRYTRAMMDVSANEDAFCMLGEFESARSPLQRDDKLLHTIDFSWTTKRIRSKDLR